MIAWVTACKRYSHSLKIERIFSVTIIGKIIKIVSGRIVAFEKVGFSLVIPSLPSFVGRWGPFQKSLVGKDGLLIVAVDLEAERCSQLTTGLGS